MPKKVAVIVSDGFEQVELDKPAQALRDAGCEVVVLAEGEDHLERIRGMDHLDAAAGTKGDKLLADARPDAFDALLVPGGAVRPDTMRRSERHLAFVRAFVDEGKPTFVICHGPWLLADAEVARGRRLTSWPAIRRDLERAGAEWVDEEVVVDGNLVTSRKPDDIPAFNREMLRLLGVERQERAAGAPDQRARGFFAAFLPSAAPPRARVDRFAARLAASSSFSATRSFTIRFTSARGSGFEGTKRIVPLACRSRRARPPRAS